jgi:hypothetical protein
MRACRRVKLGIPRTSLQWALDELVKEGLVCKHEGAGKTKRGNGYTLAGNNVVSSQDITLGHSLSDNSLEL